MSKNKCKSGKCNINKTSSNGKGDSPRNNFSKKFQDNYSKINWKKKNNK